jgi:hypothetical protein
VASSFAIQDELREDSRVGDEPRIRFARATSRDSMRTTSKLVRIGDAAMHC